MTPWLTASLDRVRVFPLDGVKNVDIKSHSITRKVSSLERDVSVIISTLWVLVAAFLVFLMHAGFAMVESGFARTKNVVNVLMKNVGTVAIGSISFFLAGFALMFGESGGGLVGLSGFALSGIDALDFGIPGMAFFVFQAMFAATCATIVSGAVAERVRLGAYFLFTVAITTLIYPVVGHWVWGGGWLASMGFYDFAGSTVVHSVGAWGALLFATLLGPRIGKYQKDGTAQPMFAHSLPLGALGVFILWFGWFGFNGGSTLDGTTESLATIVAVTLLGGAAGGVSSMLVSQLRFGQSDASLTLNGVLAGLVGITAGANVFTLPAAIVIGAAAGTILVFAVEMIDRVLRVDDVVGAVSVHGVCGAFGTLAVGLFSVDGGAFYGGGLTLLGVQALGIVTVFAWTAITSLAALSLIRLFMALRVGESEEVEGLDLAEHGMIAYGDMMLHSLSDFRRSVNTHSASLRSMEAERSSRVDRGLEKEPVTS